MRRLSLAVIAAAALAPVQPAAAATPSPTGVPCAFVGTVPNSVFRGSVVSGGPYLLTDDPDPTVIYTGSVTCTTQFASTHDGADICTVSGRVTPVVAAVAGLCPGIAPHICTQVNLTNGLTLYLAGGSPTDWWSTSSNVSCN